MNKITIIMGAIIIILALALFVIIVGIPQYNNFIYQKQSAVVPIIVNNIVNDIMNKVDVNGYVYLVGENNRTMILIKYIPPQQ